MRAKALTGESLTYGSLPAFPVTLFSGVVRGYVNSSRMTQRRWMKAETIDGRHISPSMSSSLKPEQG